MRTILYFETGENVERGRVGRGDGKRKEMKTEKK